jgi:predicted NAD-dependent protein-ADP-ribosyltransferase YbiA (DUF1768 family)
VKYQGTEWPSAQHAYQAAKVSRTFEGRAQLLEKIRTESNYKRLMNLGREVPMEPGFDDMAHKLGVMFAITYGKFQQNRNLAFRLLHGTGTKPILHVHNEPWGTRLPSTAMQSAGNRSRTNSFLSTTGAAGAPPEAPARPWYSGNNWNGRILCVVRVLLRSAVQANPEKLLENVEKDFRLHCPCPEEYIPLPAEAIYTEETPLPRGTLIAGLYLVEEEKKTHGLGSFVGGHCYICKDANPHDPAEEETIREALTSASLQSLCVSLRAALGSLCVGGGPDWAELITTCEKLHRAHFFGHTRRWWHAMEEELRRARDLAGDGALLQAAHVLRQLLPDPPLQRMPKRPRVFVKTFGLNSGAALPESEVRRRGRRIFAEIRRWASDAGQIDAD